MKKKKLSTAAVSRSGRSKRRLPAAKRKRRSPEEILNRVVQAAGEEFKRCGFAGATTATIARNADVTEAQLFRYFGSKSNLFRETIFKPLDQHFLNFINKRMPKQGKLATTRETANLYTTELQRFISEHSGMLTSLVVAQTYDTGTAQGVGEINSLSTYFDHGASVMTKGMKDKPKVDPKLMVRVSFAAVLACIMFKDWIFPPGLASSEEIRAAINDFVIEGIGANFDPRLISSS
ncbi:MAG: TetR/AcrR family transcriptional regulator [Rhodospirillaceae bacterium]|nr:MAG: TetR/AcrR family transcriptional regulator [Rhodospirillaceae bacterium]